MSIKNSIFWKMSLFQVIRKMNLFCGGKFSDRVSSEKLLAVSAAGPPAAFFPEIDMSGFFGHAHFWKSMILLRFGQNIGPGTQKYSQEAFRRLSGYSQETP